MSVDAAAVAAADTVNAFDALALGTLHSCASVKLVPRSATPECPQATKSPPALQLRSAC